MTPAKFGGLRWAQLVAIWLAGCFVLALLSLLVLRAHRGAFFLLPVPDSLHGIAAFSRAVWAVSPALALIFLAIVLYTFAIAILAVRQVLSRDGEP